MLFLHSALQFGVVTALLLGAYRLRELFGLSGVVAVVASMQFLQAILGAKFYWAIGGVTYSPGSTVMFVSNLAVVLWAFARHGVGVARVLVYGVVIGNAVPVLLSGLIQWQMATVAPLEAASLPSGVFEMVGLSSVVGVALLYLDQLIAVLGFTWLQRHTGLAAGVRYTIALTGAVVFDTIGYLGLIFGLDPNFGAMLVDGLVAKTIGAVAFGAVWGALLHTGPRTGETDVRGVFDVMLFRENVEELKRAASRDGLTGVYNRRRFDRVLRDPEGAPDRLERPRALALVDVDRLKRVNDSYGHAVGDEVLVAVADWLEKTVRRDDQVFRIGGDEFAVVLAKCDAEGGRSFADRAEQFSYSIEVDETGAGGEEAELAAVTLSIGVALDPSDASNWEALFEIADKRLYAAKDAGRGRAMGPWSE